MIISETKNVNLIKLIVTDPTLWLLEGGEGQDPKSYKPYLGHIWLKIIHNRDIIGLLELREFTKITYEGHIYILPQYHASGLALEAGVALIGYIRKLNKIKNIITTVPTSCDHVLNFLKKLGFSVNGIIQNGIIYNGKYQDLIMQQLEVR